MCFDAEELQCLTCAVCWVCWVQVSKWSASQVLHMLNALFSRFDKAVTDCKVEKIETIGDGTPCPFSAPPLLACSPLLC
jgi:hypothetical protein